MPNRPRDEPKSAEPERAASVARQSTMLFARRKLTAPAAREFAAETLTQWGCSERLDDVRLCTSELVTNALLHGTSPDDVILVRVEIHDAQLLVEVHDGGAGTPRQRQVQDSSDHGRGLLLVSAIADDWGVAAREGPGKRVWASFKVPVVTTC
ncbi:ATP-binding protein [Streptomyces cyaneochromogenes]|uniref:ATP-binding protein n=1 Tax=Streptomyces cyaneochromogenes TaxID=2496836 RepID=A0A3S9MDZ3_9ACTN|nr:ATP-binding protein [Streptomyces cyaneochromogenes]AZQ37346.1 ATP-binding protein [Streptomyces cyaneochromogenes]